jgi:hypothetical protein
MPSRDFIIGAGSILDISGSYFDCELNKKVKSDASAIASDWHAVGSDLRDSLEYHVNEITDPHERKLAKRKLEQAC